MSSYILCQIKRASLPFYIKNISMNIYSIEELCYYLYHNIYLLDETIINEHLCDWLKKELGLNRYDYGICRCETVHGDESQGRGTVDDDEIVPVPDRSNGVLEQRLPLRGFQKFQLGPHEVDGGRNHMKTSNFGLDEHVFHSPLAYEQIVKRPAFLTVRGKVESGSGVGLRVCVNDEDVLLENSERGGKVDCRRGLAHSPFLVGYSYDFSHIKYIFGDRCAGCISCKFTK